MKEHEDRFDFENPEIVIPNLVPVQFDNDWIVTDYELD